MRALGKFFWLLLSFLVLFLCFPFASSVVGGIGVLDVVGTIIFAAAIYAVSRERRVLALATTIAAPALVVNWSTYIFPSTPLAAAGHALYVLFFTLAATLVLSALIRARRITLDVVLGAVCGYFIVGLIFAYVFACLELLRPGAFITAAGQAIDAGGPGASDESSLIYFSFCTLTTVGYGDIVALSKPARSLAALEAVVGQLYLAVLVARLVGLHIAYWTFERSERP